MMLHRLILTDVVMFVASMLLFLVAVLFCDKRKNVYNFFDYAGACAVLALAFFGVGGVALAIAKIWSS